MTQPTIKTVRGPGGRWYVHPATGVQAPSVTTILSVLDKPALPRWAAKVTAEYAVANRDSWTGLDEAAAVDLLKGSPWRDSTKAAAAGTDAHTYAEDLLLGRRSLDDEFSPPGVGDEITNVRDLIATVRPEPLVVEATAWSHKDCYAGTLDGIVLVDGAVCLIDWKTSKDVYPETALQLAAYRYADVLVAPDGTEIDMPPVDRCLIFHVPKAGQWSVVEVEATPREHLAFTNLRVAFEWQAVISKTVVGQKTRPAQTPDAFPAAG